MIETNNKSAAGFTLVELLIGSTLAAMILLAMLSSYLFLGRNLGRLVNQQLVQSQSRRTLATFTQDVRMTSGIVGTPSATSLTLTLPTNTGSKSVAYYFNNSSATATVTLVGYSTTILPYNLVRVDGSTGATQVLHTTLLTFAFSYYDSSSNSGTSEPDKPYTIFDSSAAGFGSFSGIKQIALTLTAQTGSSTDGTQTPVYQVASSRLVIRNRALLQ